MRLQHAELETQAILAHRLGYVRDSDMRAFEALSGEVGRVTHGLERSIEATLGVVSDRQRQYSRTQRSSRGW